MIKSITLQKLRNSEFIQFFLNMFSIIRKYDTNELNIDGELNAVVDEVEKIKKNHGADKGSEISNELKEIDNRRDDCITGIRMIAEAYTYHYEKNIKEAAELLLNKIDDFGPSIAKQNYPTETTSINGIVDAFNTDKKFKEALNLLHLLDWAAQMDTENTYFNQRYLDRIDEQSKQSVENIKDLRKLSTEKYYTLRDHLVAHATLQGEPYTTIINQLNELIDEYNIVLNRRKGSNSHRPID